MLKAMIESGLSESVENRLDLSAYGREIVKVVVEYIYTGKARDIGKGEAAMELLKAADYFVLPGLKKLCEVKFIPTLTVKNAVDLVIVARMFTANQLEAAAKKFIVGHSRQILKQHGWREKLGNQFHDLVLDILEASLEKNAS